MAKKKPKTDKQLVEECNELAREFYAILGYTVAAGYRFDRATHPQEQMVWRMAAVAFERLNGTDIENALAELDDE